MLDASGHDLCQDGASSCSIVTSSMALLVGNDLPRRDAASTLDPESHPRTLLCNWHHPPDT